LCSLEDLLSKTSMSETRSNFNIFH
jgi:hypothetical protein